MAGRLDRLGLRTVGDVAAIPLDALQVQFGAQGQRFYWLARGVDERAISANLETEAIAADRRFDGPVTKRHILERALRELATDLTAQLHAGGWAAQAVALTVYGEDGTPWSEQRILREPTTDPAVLAQGLIALLGQAPAVVGVEQLGVAVTERRPTVAAQLELFASPHGQASWLEDALGRLSTRYRGCFMRAALADSSAFLPEQRVRFDPLNGI
jgi:DNA polymerase-4